jgi:DNA-binding winged helix-turn-helix (wHTH) protein
MNDLPDAALESSTVEIGSWTFDPRAGELRRGRETKRIEFRAAQTLALLCRRRGEIVTREEILDRVWGGRSVSQNSLAVVIRDIRRALEDDARNPLCLETVSKRGYRLAVPTQCPGHPLDRNGHGGAQAAGRGTLRRFMPAVAAGLFVTASVAAILASATGDRSAILVEPVRNESGSVALDPEARALTELAVSRLSAGGVDVFDAARAGRKASRRFFVLRSRLILWDGRPSLSLQAIDRKTGQVRWSAMAAGPPFYASVSGRLDGLARFLRTSSRPSLLFP